MGLSASRLLYLAALVACALLALFPSAGPSRWLDLGLAPVRVLGEIASPIGWFARGDARAASEALARNVQGEHAESRALAEDERWFALPDEDLLINGRRFAHAQVITSLRGAEDFVECALEEQHGGDIVPGLPVVLSNSYVGRVASVEAGAGRIIVHLVTSKEFRIGASANALVPGEPPVAMVVGGLEATRGPGTPLCVHNPSRLRELHGSVRVDESLNPRAPFRALSQGFLLGELVLFAPQRHAVMPQIDFADGLFRVVVVLPPEAPERAPAPGADVFADVNWHAVRAYSACEPASWREGLKLDIAHGSGARVDAAVVAGARLVGRISRAGALESDVALLGDAGVTVPAQARVEGELAPLVLGRLVSLGREERGGFALFRWTPIQPLAPGADGAKHRRARLFTGAGEPGVPRGLVIGECYLPSGAGPHVIAVEEPVDPRLLRRLWVWRGIERAETERGRLP